MEEKQKKESKLLWPDVKPDEPNEDLIIWLKIMGLAIFLFASGIIINNQFNLLGNSSSTDESSSDNLSTYVDESSSDSDCNVVGIELHGDVITYIPASDFDTEGSLLYNETASENVVYTINEAEKDDNIKAILLEIDSYGGSPVAGEEISDALKSAKKPTVALIRQAGDSAAYWSATGANIIFASKNSDVGGIGVTMSYLDAVEQNKKEGYTYNSLSSGKFKDTGSPDKPLTPEEVKLFMRDVNIIHQNFVKAVAENRKLDINKVEKMADGSTMLGEAALQNGLIDQIGGQAEVNQYLKDKIGEEVEICW